MSQQLRKDADRIIAEAIAAVLPDAAVERALRDQEFPGRVILVAAGKAAWQMAKAALDCMGKGIEKGIVITKYDHVKGELPGILCREAGHPVPDENSFAATREALEMVKDLQETDTVLFLLSGGGSALFELPLISGQELQDVTRQLLASGADIVKMNTVRKRLSAVKGGRFAQACAPAQVFSVVLSDILGDPLDMIASGPACPDSSTCADARAVVREYNLQLTRQTQMLLEQETPKALENVTTRITGSVRELCLAAAESCRRLGYQPEIITDRLDWEAKDAGVMLGQKARACAGKGKKVALIAGGETVVHLTGSGLGGRNQELALSAAREIDGVSDVAVFSIGSDGTDGPTDAAGGYVDGTTAQTLRLQGIGIDNVLADNDAYHGLRRCNGLIFTGPTGTNVNDVAVILVRK